eukprot:130299-Pelagomonas_calceolata.AAC.3
MIHEFRRVQLQFFCSSSSHSSHLPAVSRPCHDVNVRVTSCAYPAWGSCHDVDVPVTFCAYPAWGSCHDVDVRVIFCAYPSWGSCHDINVRVTSCAYLQGTKLQGNCLKILILENAL